MWFVVALAAAIIASAAYLLAGQARRKQYRLGFLCLMLWGVSIMVFVDHLISYLEGGPFMETETSGLIGSSVLLGILMLVPVILIWAIAAFTAWGNKICPG
ncbi:Uncharacterised protein [uncultured archaeon]|nr:Uncharacterised protein [uncultured archaeon]